MLRYTGNTGRLQWSCMCDDRCRLCGSKEISPYNSDDLTLVIKKNRPVGFLVLRSPRSAEHFPDYKVEAAFATIEEARALISKLEDEAEDED